MPFPWAYSLAAWGAMRGRFWRIPAELALFALFVLSLASVMRGLSLLARFVHTRLWRQVR